MKCQRCNSENVIATPVKKSRKGGMFAGFLLFFTGVGLMFLGILGAIIGLVLGAIIGGIVAALVPTAHETVWVCQNCGFITKSK